MPFAPGHKGMGGRPKGTGFVQRCKMWSDTKGFPMLTAMAEGRGAFKDAGATFRRDTAEFIVEHGYGKPHQTAEVDVTMTAGLADTVAAARKRVGK